MTDPTPLPPAGWYPDPAGSGGTRWWNGSSWSEGTTAPSAPAQPSAPSYPSAPENTIAPAYTSAPAYSNAPAYAAGTELLQAPDGTSPYNPFIWILAILPVVGLVDTLISFSRIDDAADVAIDASAPLFTPGDLISGAISWIVIAASVLLAVLDWRALKSASVPRPFHWAWIFFIVIGAPVYVIGRSIIVRKRVGYGLTPMVLNVILVAVTFVAGIIAGALAVGSILDSGLVP